MDFKYKIADVAKEFGVPTKKVIETVGPITGESYKTGNFGGYCHEIIGPYPAEAVPKEGGKA